MQRGTRVDDPALPVVLTESRIIELAKELADLMGDVQRKRSALKAHNTREREEIDDLVGKAERIAENIRRQEEFKDQSTLTFDETPTKDETAFALAKVALIAGNGSLEQVELLEREADKPVHVVAAPAACRKCGSDLLKLSDDAWLCGAKDCNWLAKLVPEFRGRHEDDADCYDRACEAIHSTTTIPPANARPCVGCDKPLETALEWTRGICESCSLQPAEEVDLHERYFSPASPEEHAAAVAAVIAHDDESADATVAVEGDAAEAPAEA